MRVLPPPHKVISKSPITFFDQIKIQKSTRLGSTQKISNFKIFRVPGAQMRVVFPPEEFYRKSLWQFSINSKSKNLHDFEVPKKFKFQNFQSSRSSDESSVSPPKSSTEKSYNIFRSTQNSKTYTTLKYPKNLNFKIFRVPGVLMRVLFPP